MFGKQVYGAANGEKRRKKQKKKKKIAKTLCARYKNDSASIEKRHLNATVAVYTFNNVLTDKTCFNVLFFNQFDFQFATLYSFTLDWSVWSRYEYLA